MRVLLCPVDREGSGRYRLGLPAGVLQKQETGLEIFLTDGLPVRLDERTGEAIGLAGEFGWDVLVIQRPMFEWQIPVLKDCRARGIRTVVEIDDDYEALHPRHPARLTTDPRLSKKANRKWLQAACREADLVTVTTRALAIRYASHGRVAILPNFIPESWLRISPNRRGNVVGWTGTLATHVGDLAVTHGGVAAALRETGARFRVIGHSDLVQKELGLDEEPERVPWQNYDAYPYALARFDVGIAPLANTAFSRAKSGIKPLEMAALGIPSVVSPLPSYKLLAADGIGILAEDRSRSWKRVIKRLLVDDRFREEMSASVREAAAELTIEKHAWKFAEAWVGV